jgi:hypothetical protein
MMKVVAMAGSKVVEKVDMMGMQMVDGWERLKAEKKVFVMAGRLVGLRVVELVVKMDS